MLALGRGRPGPLQPGAYGRKGWCRRYIRSVARRAARAGRCDRPRRGRSWRPSSRRSRWRRQFSRTRPASTWSSTGSCSCGTNDDVDHTHEEMQLGIRFALAGTRGPPARGRPPAPDTSVSAVLDAGVDPGDPTRATAVDAYARTLPETERGASRGIGDLATGLWRTGVRDGARSDRCSMHSTSAGRSRTSWPRGRGCAPVSSLAVKLATCGRASRVGATSRA